MPIVTMPDGTQVQFPDDMPENRIKGFIASRFPDAAVKAKQASASLPEWAQTAHSYLDPARVFAGKAGQKEDLSPAEYIPMLSMALPAGRGPVTAPASEQLHAAGGAGYGLARMSNVSLDGTKAESFANGLKAGLRRDGYYPSNASGTLSVLDDVKAGGPYFTDGKNLNASDYIALRQSLQKQAQNFNPAAAQDQKAATIAIERLDNLWDKTAHKNFVGGTPQEVEQVRSLVKDARANFAAGYRSDLLTKKQYKAELQTAATHSGMNLDNKLRQTTAGILTSPKQAQGYSPAETAAMEKIVQGVPGANAARFAGNLMGGGGGLGAVVSGGMAGAGASYATGSPWGMAIGTGIPATGVALKSVENALTKRAMTKLAEQTRLRSPMGAMAKPAPYSYDALLLKLFGLLPSLAENQ